MLMFIRMYVYVCISFPDRIMIVYANSCICVCIYVSMALFDRVIRNHSCGGMIACAGKSHEEVHGDTRNQLGRVVMKNI